MAAVPKTTKKTEVRHLKSISAQPAIFRRSPRLALLGSYRSSLGLILRVLGIVAVAIIFVQLVYPSGRGLPLASIAGKNAMLQTHSELAAQINEQFDGSKILLTLDPRHKKEFSVKILGAEPNTETMIKTASDYPLWQRLIPGSILWPMHDVRTLDLFYSDTPLENFTKAQAKAFSFAPQNARLEIKNNNIVASEAMSGSEVKASELKQTISRATLRLGESTTVQIPAKRLSAERTSKDLVLVKQEAEAVLAHTVKVTTSGQTFSPDRAVVASWVSLSTDSHGSVALSIDRVKIKAYLDEINKKVGTPAGQTNIDIVDGREVSRTVGATGKIIDSDQVVEQLAAALLAAPKQVEVTAPLKDIQPSVIFNSQYTATQAGLQAFIDDTARTKNMHISIIQLTGEKWTASSRADESIPSGSTYKLFVALVLFDKIDKGEIHWEDPMLDTTVAGCFERMTVASTNPCAEKWIAEFGRQYINDFIHARGFSDGTSFTTGSANQTTAADLTKYMIGLNDGTLVGGANRDRLLDSLGRHPYRYGIPTGSAGAVHDKVGFLWDYVHDTAIVNHPRGTYIMTIMTKGQSYAAIASVTRMVERIMYP